MTFAEGQENLCRKLKIDFSLISSNDLFTLADLKEWLNIAMKRAWDFRPWTVAEKTWSVDVDADILTDAYMDYPEDAEDESIKRFTVEGTPWKKLEWDSYQAFLTESQSSTEEIWSEHERFIFFNTNALSLSEEINLTGKKRAPTLSADADLLMFSAPTDANENSGNHAIVTLAFAEALGSDKLKRMTDAEKQETKGFAMLEALWKPIAERRANDKPKNAPLFDVPDFFGRPSRRSSPPGNFNL